MKPSGPFHLCPINVWPEFPCSTTPPSHGWLFPRCCSAAPGRSAGWWKSGAVQAAFGSLGAYLSWACLSPNFVQNVLCEVKMEKRIQRFQLQSKIEREAYTYTRRKLKLMLTAFAPFVFFDFLPFPKFAFSVTMDDGAGREYGSKVFWK